MNPRTDHRVFISYSHDDSAFVVQLSRDLRSMGQNVWLDKWEILAGESIVDKIFSEGLSEATAFLIVLSNSSARSNWVREELGFATIKRIERYAKVIPILIDPIDSNLIPAPLRSLKWVDMRKDYERGVQEVVHSLIGLRERPPVGDTPPYDQVVAVQGLSKLASLVGLYILRQHSEDDELVKSFRGEDLQKATGLDPREINDAVDELEERGMVQKVKTMGSGPFRFMWIDPTYLLWREFSQYLDYKPEDDVTAIAHAIASLETADGSELNRATLLPPGRINRAIDYIRDYGLAQVERWMGTSPYTFGRVRATFRTRQI
jgi:hypothetical protein